MRDADGALTRRLILQGAIACGLAGLGVAASGFWPALASDAPNWPSEAFKQKNEADAL